MPQEAFMGCSPHPGLKAAFQATSGAFQSTLTGGVNMG